MDDRSYVRLTFKQRLALAKRAREIAEKRAAEPAFDRMMRRLERANADDHP